MNFHDETGPSSTRAARLTLTFCCVIVFLGSVGIMVLELTASRLIARAVGQSLYTWTSVIGVVLAGLSAGNILGGRIVERPYAGRWLSAMFVAAGILCLAAEPIMGMFVAVGRPSWFNWPAWVVVTVSSVLLAPSVALGTISPIAASIALLRARRIGMTMGNIYAWGALGSILGTFATGYFLVNVMGTREILWALAAALVASGALSWMMLDRLTREAPGQARPRLRLSPADWQVLARCIGLVFVSSVCVMVLELTASRIIAKTYGTSLYTWTSVIGIILGGLTIGNYAGGWLADRSEPRPMLVVLFTMASLGCLAIYPFSRIIDSPAWQTGDYRWRVFQGVAVCYLFPAVTLGAISPIVASLALSRTQRGEAVGLVYAGGAIGSIVGTFLAGFWLIDAFGTQAIVWVVSASLAVLGAAVAPGQGARVFLLTGWAQFVVWIGLFSSVRPTELPSTSQDGEWEKFFRGVRVALHDVGLKLKLREDNADDYYDESNYCAIRVGTTRDRATGDLIQALYLDHLTHSYWNRLDPDRLYYDYELVYAAVTERAAGRLARTTTVETSLPTGVTPAGLPEFVAYDPGKKTLTAHGALGYEQRRQLLVLSRYAGWWSAVDEIRRIQQVDEESEFATAPLAELPDGVEIPEGLSEKVRFDASLKSLIAYKRLDPAEMATLYGLGHDQEWRQAVADLHRQSRQVSTFFIGGGGFVFPRWIESKFPGSDVIHVAELDPAVLLAVERAMGLPAPQDTRIKTFLGDARNTIDDRIQQNARAQKRGEPPVLYDFVYGDAFNHYSVPWHLTTRELSEKIRAMLTPDGVFLVNVIDIYPRNEWPRVKDVVQSAEVEVPLPVPAALAARADRDGDLSGFHGIRISRRSETSFHLATRRAIDEKRLEQHIQQLNSLELAEAERLSLTVVFNDLARRSNRRQVIASGLPEFVTQSAERGHWAPVAGTGGRLEVLELADDDDGLRGYVVGYRGVMTSGEREALIARDSQNAAYVELVGRLYAESQRNLAGGFLGAYVETLCAVFPCVYVFSSQEGPPSATRDTFVVACSLTPLDLGNLADTGYWSEPPFASRVLGGNGAETQEGAMEAVRGLARGRTLTDNNAPVDNLLIPLFAEPD